MNIARCADTSHQRGRLRQRLVAVLVACLAAVLAGPGVPANAQVPSVDLACPLLAQINFSPPLNFNTTSGSASAQFTNCLSPNGSQPQLTSGVMNVSGTARGCSPLPLTFMGNGSIVWNDSSTTTFPFSVITNPFGGGQLGFNAVMTAGPMAGDNATAVPVIISQNGLCGLGGVRSLTLNFGVVAFFH